MIKINQAIIIAVENYLYRYIYEISISFLPATPCPVKLMKMNTEITTETNIFVDIVFSFFIFILLSSLMKFKCLHKDVTQSHFAKTESWRQFNLIETNNCCYINYFLIKYHYQQIYYHNWIHKNLNWSQIEDISFFMSFV